MHRYRLPREKERVREKVRRRYGLESMQVPPLLRFDRLPLSRLDGPPMSWGTPSPQRDMLCLTTSVGGCGRKGRVGGGSGRKSKGRGFGGFGAGASTTGGTGRSDVDLAQAEIWRARSKWEHGKRERGLQHMGSAMKPWELSVRVSCAFLQLGIHARLVSWG